MILFYYVATTAMKALLTAFTRWRVEGKENVPRKGPLIVVSNHMTYVDPPLLGASVPRRITFMAKQELFRPSLMGLVVRAYGAFPVRRDRFDREALRHALEVLNQEDVLGMFPEGKRSFSHQLQEIQAGTAFIAAHSGAPIVPVGISGSEQVRGIGFIVRRPSIIVRIGRPFTLPSNEDIGPNRSRLDQYANLITERIAELLPPKYRGNHNFQNSLGSSNGN
jgi:1-acyl-sn-glycerol-3-phosphate acyltransferase